MKKEYVRPTMVGERFTPNEYVAACGESGTTYKFVCDAKRKYGFDYGGGVYQETNGIPGLQKLINPDKYLGSYRDCYETHIVESTDEFLDGYFDPYGIVDAQPRRVIIWTNNNTNLHCTSQLDKTDWETAKS